MKVAKASAFAATLLMFITFCYGFKADDFFKEGSLLFSMEWVKVSLIAVYIGFFLFSGWVIYRERNWMTAVFWSPLKMIFWNFTAYMCITITLFTSREVFKRFWLRKHYQI